MQFLACDRISARLGQGETYLLLVSSDCPYCTQVLEEFHGYNFRHPVIIVNYDACHADVDVVLKDLEALPALIHLNQGSEVRRAVGVDEIEAFDEQPVPTQQPVVETTSPVEGGSV